MSRIDPNRLCPDCLREMPQRGGKCPFCGYTSDAEEISPRCMPPYTVLAGRYFIGTVLGEGGFGITYKGWDLKENRKVAIKEYFPAGLVTRDTSRGGDNTVQSISGQMREHYRAGLQKYENEARCLMELKGTPGIVDILSFFHENATAYIVMEFIEGMTLRDYLAVSSGSVEEKRVLEMFRPLLNSLHSIHQTGIVHRDISPDNIIVQADGTLKLIDFGAARQFTGESTQSLTVILKHGYAPEEQYRSRSKQGAFTDVYAISATIYKVLTGVTPVDALSRMFEDELKPLEQYPNRITPQTCGAIKKGMGVRVADRLQTVAELISALYEKEITVEPTLAMPVVKRKHAGRMLTLIAAGVMICTAAVIGISALTNAGTAVPFAEALQQVPDVIGKTESVAKALLEAQDFIVGVQYAPADSAHTGKVLRCDLTSEQSVNIIVGELTSFSFEENSDGLTVTGCSNRQRNLNIPQTINGIQVTQIGAYAFSEADQPEERIQRLTLPEGLLCIGEGAFNNCIYLETVEIPDTVTTIDASAFWNCNGIRNISLPSALVSVGDYAFQYCFCLPEIILPQGCKTVGVQSFEGCLSAKTAVIPSTVTQIGAGAFTSCMELELQVVAGSYGEEYAKLGTVPYKTVDR